MNLIKLAASAFDDFNRETVGTSAPAPNLDITRTVDTVPMNRIIALGDSNGATAPSPAKNRRKNLVKLSADPCKECERLRMQLAGCGVAALGYAKGQNAITKSNPYWSASYGDVVTLRKKYEKLLKESSHAS